MIKDSGFKKEPRKRKKTIKLKKKIGLCLGLWLLIQLCSATAEQCVEDLDWPYPLGPVSSLLQSMLINTKRLSLCMELCTPRC